MSEKAIRVTLSTGRVVWLRVPKIKHQETAMRVVGKSAGDNKELFNFLTGVEMVKLLLARIDDKDFHYKDLANNSLDDMFTSRELKELGKAIEQFTKDDDDFLPKIEAVVIGE